MTVRESVWVAVALVVTLTGPVAAAPPTLVVPRVTAPPTIDLYVQAGATPPGARVEGFVQREPGDGTPSQVATTAFLAYDDDHLYVAFVCKDDPAQVRANLTKREGILGDDVVGIVLDPYHDGRRSYLFLVNPLGIQMDGVTGEGVDDDYNFDALWYSEGRLTADGFVVFVRLPFRSLRFHPAPTQTWGIALGRVSPRFNETAFWPYITRRVSAFGPQMATLEGLRDVSPGRNLQAIPYGNFASARYLEDDGRSVRDNRARVGVDAKAVIRDTVTVDLTVNPDYSQVESDEPQVTVNQRFEVFFPEKRPFFIENAGYFATPETLFFSRRVADPNVGVRVTGKARGWSFGLLGADDAAVTGADRARAGVGVVRVQREFSKQSWIGGLVTGWERGSGSNRVLSLDGRWRVNDTWTVQGQVMRSWSDREADARAGTGYRMQLVRETRTWDVYAGYRSIAPSFETALGYVPRTDVRDVDAEIGYDWYPKTRGVLRYGAEVGGSALWDHAGILQDWLAYGKLDLELPGQTQVSVVHRQAFERYRGIEFRPSRTRTQISTEWLRWLNVSAGASFGEGLNYYPVPGMEPFLGRTRAAEVSVTLKPMAQLRVDQAYLYSTLRRPGDACGCAASGTAVYANHIARTRVSYQFTKALSLRAILDVDAVEPTATLIALDRTRRTRADVLFTYLVNPWTAVYAGYTDAYENLDLTDDRLSRHGGGATTSVGRQIFVKISYLLRS